LLEVIFLYSSLRRLISVILDIVKTWKKFCGYGYVSTDLLFPDPQLCFEDKKAAFSSFTSFRYLSYLIMKLE